MFTSENVQAYLKSIVLKVEAKKRMAVLRFFVTPITHELAGEASPAIADRLFHHRNGEGYRPVQEMGRTEFLVRIPPASMSYQRHPEYVGHHVLIQNVSFGGVSAQKVIPDDPNFSLIFDASFEINDKTVIADLVDLLHEKVYLTFKPVQARLFPDKNEWAGALCRLCEAPNPEWGVEGSKPKIAYCDKCKDQKIDDEHLIRIADHARAQVAAEEEKADESKPGDPLLAGADINKRASQRQRKGRVN